MDNYRPVTVLPVCSKSVFTNNLLTFRRPETFVSYTVWFQKKEKHYKYAATLLLEQIRQNTDSGKITGAIFIDLSKAFDTLGHSQIIENIGFKENDLFTNYLFGRTQSVRMGN